MVDCAPIRVTMVRNHNITDLSVKVSFSPPMTRAKADIAKSIADEAAIQVALEAVLASGLNKKNRPNLSLRKAAETYNVSRSALTGRWNGRLTRREAQVERQKLSPSQEEILKDWAKVMGRRGVPLGFEAIADYASVIVGEHVSVNWARDFRLRHPDLRSRWTTGLESCRARCLNRTMITEYFDILEELLTTYNIPIENVYNMDEKGIQLGIGKRAMVLVDRDHKGSVYHVEDGNRELVTVIETPCADGTWLHPSVIYKGKTRDLEWGRNNPCGARCVICTGMCHGRLNWNPPTASPSLRKDGPTTSLGLCGSRKTSNLQVPSKTLQMAIDCSFLTDTIHTARTGSARLQSPRESSSCVSLRTPLMHANLAMSASLDL